MQCIRILQDIRYVCARDVVAKRCTRTMLVLLSRQRKAASVVYGSLHGCIIVHDLQRPMHGSVKVPAQGSVRRSTLELEAAAVDAVGRRRVCTQLQTSGPRSGLQGCPISGSLEVGATSSSACDRALA